MTPLPSSRYGTAPLGYLADIRPSGVDKHTIEGECAVRLCNYTDVYYREHISADIDFMEATATLAEIERFYLRPGDIAITKDSETADDIGIPAVVTEPLGHVLLGYHNALIRPRREAVEPRFLFWTFASKVAAAYWEIKAKGVTRVGLRSDDIAAFPVPLPDREVQVRTADILDHETARIDRVIEKNDSVLDLANLRLNAFVNATVWGYRSEHDPTRWTDTKVKCLINEVDVRAGPRALELPHLSVSEYRGVVLRRTDDVGQAASEDSSHYKICQAGDLVLNKLWAFRGAVGVAFCEGLVSPDYAVLRPAPGVSSRYLHHLSRSARFVAAMAAKSRGVGGVDTSASRSPRIGIHALGQIPVALPNTSRQEEMAAELDKAVEDTGRLQERVSRMNHLLCLRRQSLITAAVTGEIEV